jgi:urease accessory protein UreH
VFIDDFLKISKFYQESNVTLEIMINLASHSSLIYTFISLKGWSNGEGFEYSTLEVMSLILNSIINKQKKSLRIYKSSLKILKVG